MVRVNKKWFGRNKCIITILTVNIDGLNSEDRNSQIRF